MLIGVFKSNQKLVNIFVIVLTVILFLPAFFIDLEIDFLHLISTNIRWLDILLTILIISGQAIYLNILVGEYKLVEGNSHLTSLMFVLFNSACLFFLNLNQVVLANLFVLVAFHQLLRMYNLKSNTIIMFNASFLIALASLIYLPSIVYFILLWITLMYTTTPKWRDFIISIIGFSAPIIYYVTYQFVFRDLSQVNLADELIAIFDVRWSSFPLSLKVFFITFMIISLLSFLGLATSMSKSVVRVRKMLVVVVLMCIIGLGTLFLNQFDYLATFLVVSIPLSIIVAKFFQNIRKKWQSEMLFVCLIVGIVLSYFS